MTSKKFPCIQCPLVNPAKIYLLHDLFQALSISLNHSFLHVSLISLCSQFLWHLADPKYYLNYITDGYYRQICKLLKKKILVLLLLCLPRSLKYNYYQATNNKNENISDFTSKFGEQYYK